MSGTKLSLARLDTLIFTSVRCLKVHDSRGGHRQKFFADTFSQMIPKATDQIIGSIRQYIMYWHPDKMLIPKAVITVQESQDALHSIKRIPAVIIRVASISKTLELFTITIFNSTSSFFFTDDI